MLKMLKQGAFFGLVLCSTAATSADIYGVDFTKINWENLCPNVKPLSVRGCNTVHPTSSLLNNNPQTRIKDKNLKCEIQTKNFKRIITPSKSRHKQLKWGKCTNRFIVAYQWRVRLPEYFTENESAEVWRDRYLKDGVVDKNSHIMEKN